MVMSLIAIAAVSSNGIIGNSKLNTMPWHCSEELQFFKRETMGKIIVMGRTTAEQVGKLPDRECIVISRDSNYKLKDFTVMNKFDLLDCVDYNPTIDYMICGGAEIYRLFMYECDHTIISYMKFTAEGDVRLPISNEADDVWKITEEINYDEFTVIKSSKCKYVPPCSID